MTPPELRRLVHVASACIAQVEHTTGHRDDGTLPSARFRDDPGHRSAPLLAPWALCGPREPYVHRIRATPQVRGARSRMARPS